MSDEFTKLIRKLKVPLLTGAEMAGLQQLQNEWLHWREREEQIMPPRIEEERRLAFEAFVAYPTPEHEHRLTVLADTNLTGVRYAVLRRAFAAIRARVSAQATQILRPALQRISAALEAEHARRLEKAEPVMSSKLRNPLVIESRRAVEYADRLSAHVFTACDGKYGDRSPLELADVLIGMSKAGTLTPEAGQ